MTNSFSRNGRHAQSSYVHVELEFGIRKDGEFKTFFFFDADQLKRPKS